MAPSLAAYLRQAVGRQFEWGACDCFLFACDWVAACRGVDPAEPYRGRYRSQRGAQRHIARQGGFSVLVSAAMAQAGLRVTDRPELGDVALIETSEGPTMVIRTATGWAGKSPCGLVITKAAPIMAWAV